MPLPGHGFQFDSPVVSQTTLNHRLQAAIPSGSVFHGSSAFPHEGAAEPHISKLVHSSGADRCHLERLPLNDIERLLLKTRNSALLKEPLFRPDFTYLSGEAAKYLAAFPVRLVGIDYLSIDPYGTDGFPAHQALLGWGIAIVEGLDLTEISEGWYELVCLPMKLMGVDGAPVRAVLRTTPH